MLLFPHDYASWNLVDAAKGPDNIPARAGAFAEAKQLISKNGQAKPGRRIALVYAAGRYFAAVGSGAGLSESELR
jgi:hypothetical protein